MLFDLASQINRLCDDDIDAVQQKAAVLKKLANVLGLWKLILSSTCTLELAQTTMLKNRGIDPDAQASQRKQGLDSD